MQITERGQITIPKRLRLKYGLDASVEIEVVEKDNQLVIVKAPVGETPIDRIYGILQDGESSDDYIKTVRGIE